MTQTVKNLPAMRGPGFDPGSRRSVGEGMAATPVFLPGEGHRWRRTPRMDNSQSLGSQRAGRD